MAATRFLKRRRSCVRLCPSTASICHSSCEGSSTRYSQRQQSCHHTSSPCVRSGYMGHGLINVPTLGKGGRIAGTPQKHIRIVRHSSLPPQNHRESLMRETVNCPEGVQCGRDTSMLASCSSSDDAPDRDRWATSLSHPPRILVSSFASVRAHK